VDTHARTHTRGRMADKKPTATAIAERDELILRLRMQGADYRSIARQMTARGQKISKSMVCKIVNRNLKESRERLSEDVGNLRELEAKRLDALLSVAWGKAIGHRETATAPAVVPDLRAQEQVLRIAKRRAELLGLDAPTKQEHTGAHGGPIETKAAPTDELSALTDSELDQWIALKRKMQPPAAGEDHGHEDEG